MKFTSVASVALLAWNAIAAPALSARTSEWESCLSRSYIAGLIDKEIIFLYHTDKAAATKIGYEIFDANINEYGDSINSLRGAPLGTQVEFNATQYVTETVASPSYTKIESVSLTIECNQFVWQWKFYGVGPPTAPNAYISGFTLGKVNAAGKIYYQYVEFNSLAWAVNSGYTVTPPTTGPFAAPSGS